MLPCIVAPVILVISFALFFKDEDGLTTKRELMLSSVMLTLVFVACLVAALTR